MLAGSCINTSSPNPLSVQPMHTPCFELKIWSHVLKMPLVVNGSICHISSRDVEASRNEIAMDF